MKNDYYFTFKLKILYLYLLGPEYVEVGRVDDLSCTYVPVSTIVNSCSILFPLSLLTIHSVNYSEADPPLIFHNLSLKEDKNALLFNANDTPLSYLEKN